MIVGLGDELKPATQLGYEHITQECKDSTQINYDTIQSVSKKQNSIMKDANNAVLFD